MKSMKRAFAVPVVFLLVGVSAHWATVTAANAQQGPEGSIPGPGPHEERNFAPQAAPMAPHMNGSAMEPATRTIFFDTGRSDLKEDAKAILADVAALLMSNPDTMVVVEGHTDSVGGELYNLQLGQARAYAARKYLLRDHGIEPRRVHAVVFGKAVPMADNSTEEGRAKNRRAAMKVVPVGSPVAGLR